MADVVLGSDGSAAALIQLGRPAIGGLELHLDGVVLAGRAVRTMTAGVQDCVSRYGLTLAGLSGVIAHGGNGRLPALLARRLGLPPERVWSEVACTGNLGAASLPAAWAMRQLVVRGPVVWTAVGAGLNWGTVLSGRP
jgi:3-oxoacyl-[acyl-carrier-protein] synthase-3